MTWSMTIIALSFPMAGPASNGQAQGRQVHSRQIYFVKHTLPHNARPACNAMQSV